MGFATGRIRRAAVVVPSITDFYFTPRRHTSLGARILADALRGRDIEVSFLDFPGDARTQPGTDLPGILEYLRPHIIPGERGPLSFFTFYKGLGPAPVDQADVISDTKPDAVFLSSFAFAYADDVIDLADAVRHRLPDIPIILGGPGAAVHPGYYADSSIDAVAVGPAESVGELLSLMESGRRDLPRVIEPGDAPAHEATFTAAVRRNTCTLLVSRGCPKRCRFCSIHLTQGNSFRRLDPDALRRGLAEIRVSGIDAVNFEDDNLLFDLPYLRTVIGEVKRRFPDARIRAENGLDPEYLTPEALELLANGGMEHLNLSLAAHHPDASLREHRTPVADRLSVIIDQARGLDMEATVFWICGLETDTPERVVETMVFLAGLGCASGISPFYPVPGLPGFTDVSLFPAGHAILTKGSSVYPWNRTLTTGELATAFRLSRLITLGANRHLDPELFDRCRNERALFTRTAKGIIRIPESTIDQKIVDGFFETCGSSFGKPRK